MYKALYRQYRPQNFDEIIAQDHIVRALKNQIKNNTIGHAYLFTGERGTGKTSTAKVFARAINCLENLDGNPCNHCEACKLVLEEETMDIVEMDAASNRSIDNIRSLKEKTIYYPSHLKYKVYIIDEVHMLTTEAFNALLKTLEEPPSHLVFILATTEVEKLPATILSRCQRFDFKRVPSEQLAGNIKRILPELGIEIEDAALRLIVANSDGSVRDSLSITDKLLAYSDKIVSLEDTLEVLGLTNYESILSIISAVIDRDLGKAIKVVDEVLQRGKDVAQLLRDIIYHFRNIMVLLSTEDYRDIIIADEELLNSYSALSKSLSLERIVEILSSLTDRENELRRSTQPKILLEVALAMLIAEPSREEEKSSKPRKSKEKIVASSPKLEKKEDIAIKPENKENKKIEEVKAKANTMPKAQKTAPESAENEEELSLEKLQNDWDNFILSLDDKMIKVSLSPGKASELIGNRLTISFSPDSAISMNLTKTEKNMIYISNKLNEYFGSPLEIRIELEQAKRVIDYAMEKKVVDYFGNDNIKK